MKRYEITSSLRVFIIWVSLSLLLMGFDRFGLLSFLRSGVEMILIPVELRVYQMSLNARRPFLAFTFWKSGMQKITDLERQVGELMVDSMRVQQLEEENASLRSLIDAPLPSAWKFIPSTLLGRGSDITLSAGRVHGVDVGDVVVSDEILIGSIAEVTERRSRLLLLSDPRTKISVYIPRSKAEGLLTGRFGSQIVMTQVLQNEDIRDQDMVVTTGEFGAPRGLVVGVVADTISDETDVHKEVLVRSLVDLDDLTTVFVVLDTE